MKITCEVILEYRERGQVWNRRNDTNLTSCCLGSMICRKTKTSALAVDESFFFFAFLFSIFNQELQKK